MSVHSSIYEQHDVFFSRIISMIPRELYRPAEEDEMVENNTRYYKHKKQPLPIDVKKEITKRKKAEKYSMNTGDSEGEKSDDGDDVEEGSDDKDDEVQKSDTKSGEGGNTATSLFLSCNDDNSMQTLRKRLQSRIESMKDARTSKKRPFEPSNNNKKDKQQKVQRNSANKVKGAGEKIKDSGSAHTTSGNDTEQSSSGNRTESDVGLMENLAGDVDIDYSTLSGNGEDSFKVGANKNKGKPGTKKQRLERMLEDADKRRQRLEKLRRGGEEGKKRLKEEQWNDVINQVSGNDTIDTQKVRKALKRRERDKQKSAQAWNARTKAVEDHEKGKIQKREGNLKERKMLINGTTPIPTAEEVKAETRSGGRNKEKALQRNGARKEMKRPGFEGKSGSGQFLNSKHKKVQAKAQAKKDED